MNIVREGTRPGHMGLAVVRVHTMLCTDPFGTVCRAALSIAATFCLSWFAGTGPIETVVRATLTVVRTFGRNRPTGTFFIVTGIRTAVIVLCAGLINGRAAYRLCSIQAAETEHPSQGTCKEHLDGLSTGPAGSQRSGQRVKFT